MNNKIILTILLISTLFIFGCSSSSEYDKKISEIKSLFDEGKYIEASRLMGDMEIKKEDLGFSIDVLEKSLESLEGIQKGLTIVDIKRIKDGNYIYSTGAVKNIGNVSYNYIKVKAIYLDKDNNVIDTDWTYAVSSENLKPNEQKYFEIMTKYQKGIEKVSLQIDDFNYE